MHRVAYLLFILIAGLFIFLGGGAFRGTEESYTLDSLLIRRQFASSPVLSAEESMKTMQLEAGFKIELVAKEPLTRTPVAMIFDRLGRLWVAEMESYMPDTLGTGEDQPRGKIVILSDSDRDGIMDQRKVFLDSLVLPRALCLIGDGILIAESPNLWYYQIREDRPVKKTLVDAAYAEGGNVEHQPNGLFRALDNWIYNAKSDKRYRKHGDQWMIEKTHFRGQWGITQDEYGRLFYNNNSENLLGDLFSPGFGASNKNQKSVSGFNNKIVANNKVYPARATTGVNRAYLPGILDDSLRLVNFTAACGPVIYSGHLFSKGYYGNAFVAEPSANLIKRNILINEGNSITGVQALANTEFLRSTDERFRPVNLYNGPDGALYITDMYRGIIQHKTYLTPYLRNEIKERSLTEPLSYGRIYRVVPVGRKVKPVQFPGDRNKMIKLLGHDNGWVRSMAQQLLVDSGDKTLIPRLRELVNVAKDIRLITHALWTIEGLGGLTKDDILPLLEGPSRELRTQAFTLSTTMIGKDNYRDFLDAFDKLIQKGDSLSAPYIAFLAGKIKPVDQPAHKDLLLKLGRAFGNDVYTTDAIISSLENEEAAYYKLISQFRPDTALQINKRLQKLLEDVEKSKLAKRDVSQQFPRGASIYKSFCQTCHGPDGNGVSSLAPPLNNSEWVTGDKNKLSAIVLYGLTGPILIGNKLYKAPEINGDMPGIASNSDFSDGDIAQLLNYIRNSWANKAITVQPNEVTDTRNRFKGRKTPFTMEELNGF
jgi:mono/diheme cytochrome c family protein/glucose/arabinose dehydrogenase